MPHRQGQTFVMATEPIRIALYARGMTTREIAEHIGELYGAEISPDPVSAVSDTLDACDLLAPLY
jgi:putative transposase